MSAPHEVAEHRRRVRVDTVIVAVDKVVGDEADEALRECACRAAGGCDEVGLGEVLTSYLWERVWAKDAWLDILHRLIHVERCPV
jgi:hypothetical protein